MAVSEVVVNGKPCRIEGEPDRPLLWVLRDELDLTGTKYGCGEGQCGACTVLIEGRPVRSCITRLSSATGKRITTIEGLANGGQLHPVQAAFIQAGAMQCGYCTAGMIMATAGLLARNPHPGDAEIRQALQGNLCRCGTYPRIVEAVRLAAKGRSMALPPTKADEDAPGWGRRFRLPNAGEFECRNMAGGTACPTNARSGSSKGRNHA